MGVCIKLVVVLLGLLLMIAGLAACGPSAEPPADETTFKIAPRAEVDMLIPATSAPTPAAAPGAEPRADVEAVTTVTVDALASEEESRLVPALSAGEVDDNERWEEYLQYRGRYSGPAVHDVDISERYVVTVLDANNRPVPNARVSVLAGADSPSTADDADPNLSPFFEGRTYANGQTLFFPRAFSGTEGIETFRLNVESGDIKQSLDFARNRGTEWVVTLDFASEDSTGIPLDVLFLLDSTGSMSDEIDRIKGTLLSISARISDLPSLPHLRFGMVVYRDRGDEFITRTYDFQEDIQAFSGTVRQVRADEGGDTPESLNEALHVAVHEPSWRLGEGIRLVFLLADAPPHLDYPQDYDYAGEMIEAHRQGIKIFSIASSGLDNQGEYVFRQIAQHTMGRFIFIIYGGEDGSGGYIPHDVQQYSVERLDDLVVELVKKELAFLTE